MWQKMSFLRDWSCDFKTKSPIATFSKQKQDVAKKRSKLKMMLTSNAPQKKKKFSYELSTLNVIKTLPKKNTYIVCGI